MQAAGHSTLGGGEKRGGRGQGQGSMVFGVWG